MDITFYNEATNRQETYELASFGARLAARLIDVLIIFIPSAIVPIVPSWLYWALQHSSKAQATVGQKALGIKVMGVHGQRINFGIATGRFFGNILNIMTLFFGYFMFFFNDKRQCLHDSLAGCVVVKETPIYAESDLIDSLFE